MTPETVLLLLYLGSACIALRTMWLVHGPLAVAITALLKAAGRWLDGTNRRTTERDIIRRLESER